MIALVLALAAAAGAVQEARHAEVARQTMVEWTRQTHARLKALGHVTQAVQVLSRSGAASPGSAEYDFRAGLCRVYVDEELARQKYYGSGIGLRFMVYHELAHCRLFAQPHELRPLPQLSAAANRLLSDAVHLDYAGWVSGRLNGYLVYHETYADVKALALLLREGETPRSLRPIFEIRDRNPGFNYDPHQSAGVYAEVFAQDWSRLDADAVDALARRITDRHILENFFVPAFGKVNIAFMGVTDLVHHAARSAPADLLFEHLEIRRAVSQRLALLEGAPQPAWAALLRLMRPGLTPDQVAQAFFLERYGVPKEALAAEDAAIRAALAPLTN